MPPNSSWESNLVSSDERTTERIVLLAVMALLLSVSTGQCQPAKAEQFIVPTRGAFLRGLKLDSPELPAVKAALDNGDIEAAGKAYIAYFRTKEIASLLVIDWAGRKRNPDCDTSVADLSDIPEMAAETADGVTTWLLPIKDATLRFASSIDHCSVQQ